MPDAKSSLKLRLALADFGIEIPGHCIIAPRLRIKVSLPLRLRVPSHRIFHHLLRGKVITVTVIIHMQ